VPLSSNRTLDALRSCSIWQVPVPRRVKVLMFDVSRYVSFLMHYSMVHYEMVGLVHARGMKI